MKFKFLDKVACGTEFHCGSIGTIVGNCANQYRIRFNLIDATGKYCSFYDDTIEECFLEKFDE